MIQNQAEGGVSLVGISGAQTMGMKLNGKAFSALVDKLYTDKSGAVVREISANARDAMVMAGKADQPFEIHLPNELNHEIVFRDEGVGLSKEDTMKYLGNLFESSKENENQSIGTYGLGSKSPFAVTDSYIVESRFNGEKHVFNWFRSPGGVPDFLHISTTPTDEPNGITFKIPSAVSMFKEYEKSLVAQLAFFDPKPIVYGFNGIYDPWEGFMEVKLDFGDSKVVKSSGLYERYGSFIADMGGVLYPMNPSFFRNIDIESDAIQDDPDMLKRANDVLQYGLSNLERSNFGLTNNSVLVVKFAIGELDVPPSRESIEYGPIFNVRICEKLQRAKSLIDEYWAAEVKKTIDALIAEGRSATACAKTLTDLDQIISFRRSQAKPYEVLKWDLKVWGEDCSWPDYKGQTEHTVALDWCNFVSFSTPSSIPMPHHRIEYVDSVILYAPISSPEEEDLIETAIERAIIQQAQKDAGDDTFIPTVLDSETYDLRTFERRFRNKLAAGWRIVSDNIRDSLTSEKRREVRFEGDCEKWEPNIYISSRSVIPEYGVQTCTHARYEPLTEFKVADLYRNHRDQRTLWVIEDKEIDQSGRRLGFYLRRLALEIRQHDGRKFEELTDDEKEAIVDICPADVISSYNQKLFKDVRWVKFKGEQDLEIFKKVLQMRGDRVEDSCFIKASELPPVWIRKSNQASSTIRGARISMAKVCFNMEHNCGRYHNGPINPKKVSVHSEGYYDENDYKPLGENILPGIVLFNDGETNRLYFDKECKTFASSEMIRRLMRVMILSKAENVNKLRSKFRSYCRNVNNMSRFETSLDFEIPIYRLTPSAHKHIDTFLKAGCFDPAIAVQEMAARNRVGRPQLHKLSRNLRACMVRSLLRSPAVVGDFNFPDSQLDKVQCDTVKLAIKMRGEAGGMIISEDHFFDWVIRYAIFFRRPTWTELICVAFDDYGRGSFYPLRTAVKKKIDSSFEKHVRENSVEFIKTCSIYERNNSYFSEALKLVLAKL